MTGKFSKFNIIFLLIFVLQLIAEYFQISTLRYVTKPLIVLSLLIAFAVSTKLKGRFHKRLFTGLIFSFIGDILLMFVGKDETYFICGLLAFLLCHIFYIRAFYLDFSSAPELDKRGARIAILLCAVFSITFYIYIRQNLGSMKLPVMIYTFVISLMVMMAVFRNQRVNKESFKLILFGAMLFLVSDSLLAYNKFVKGFELSGLLIMATYMAAQFLITKGGMERQLLRK